VLFVKIAQFEQDFLDQCRKPSPSHDSAVMILPKMILSFGCGSAALGLCVKSEAILTSFDQF
jgi:hypothetical protein